MREMCAKVTMVTNGEITKVKNINKLGVWSAISGKDQEILRRTWPYEHPGNRKQNSWTWADNQRGCLEGVTQEQGRAQYLEETSVSRGLPAGWGK